MTADAPSVQYTWRLRSLEYEGFPLHVRWPSGLDYDALAAHFPKLVVLSHVFSFRRFDGSPEPTYNDTLETLDVAVTSSFKSDGLGQIVLVETFGGKRNYYFYVASSVDGATFCGALQRQFGGCNFEVTARDDASWTFIRKYRADYLDGA